MAHVRLVQYRVDCLAVVARFFGAALYSGSLCYGDRFHTCISLITGGIDLYEAQNKSYMGRQKVPFL